MEMCANEKTALFSSFDNDMLPVLVLGTGVAYTVGMIVDVPSNFSKNHTECIHSNYNDTNNTCHEIVAIR